jgi:death-on-curing protein
VSPEFLDLAEVIEIHRDQLERYGGAPGVHDWGLLQSALAMPSAGAQGQYFHSFPFEMAAAYLYHLTLNHPFRDGNKRVAAVATLVFLLLNDVPMAISNEGLIELVLAVAEGKHDKPSIAHCLKRHAAKH